MITEKEKTALLYWLMNNSITDEVSKLELIVKHIDHYFQSQTEDQYWEKRCLAAEYFISKSPCDPDITSEQIKAHLIWQDIKDQSPDCHQRTHHTTSPVIR